MIWLVGVGPMAVEYSKVLRSLSLDFVAIGRGAESAANFERETGQKAIAGGVSAYLGVTDTLPDLAIVATSVETLAPVTACLLKAGVKRVLLEKPGGLDTDQIGRLSELAGEHNADVLVAYNRRFYSSVLRAEEIIESDGGVRSFGFEFTEWGHVVSKTDKPAETLNAWLLANSSHVIDLAFYLGGQPRKGHCFSSGEGDLIWHPGASIFTGAGVSETGALFSYQADWGAPGRWNLEILTNKSRLIFKPMEQLHVQEIGSVAVQRAEIDDALDKQFKPGLMRQVRDFVARKDTRFCTLSEQFKMSSYCDLIKSGGNL